MLSYRCNQDLILFISIEGSFPNGPISSILILMVMMKINRFRFQHRSAMPIGHSRFHTLMITEQKCARSRQKSYRLMIMKLSET